MLSHYTDSRAGYFRRSLMPGRLIVVLCRYRLILFTPLQVHQQRPLEFASLLRGVKAAGRRRLMQLLAMREQGILSGRLKYIEQLSNEATHDLPSPRASQ